MQRPGFWDDQESAAKVSAEHSRATRRLELWQGLQRDAGDLETLIELESARELPLGLRVDAFILIE